VSASVLFVCTGNVCRSPAAERVLRHLLEPCLPLEVGSAGTSPLLGMGIDPPTAEALEYLGISSSRHEARAVGARDIGTADLILCATTAHRGLILQRMPAAMRKTFTIKEFARLAATAPPAVGLPHCDSDGARSYLRTRVEQVAQQRGRSQAPPDEDIADPYRMGAAMARATVSEIVDCSHRIALALGVLPSA
jgi:protein-tyrosine phosphatase